MSLIHNHKIISSYRIKIEDHFLCLTSFVQFSAMGYYFCIKRCRLVKNYSLVEKRYYGLPYTDSFSFESFSECREMLYYLIEKALKNPYNDVFDQIPKYEMLVENLNG